MRFCLVISLLFILVNCRENTSPLFKYLTEVHYCKNPSQYRAIVFLPQNSCPSCLKKIISFLNNQKTILDNTGIVIAGYGRPEIISIRSALKKRNNPFFIDIKYQYLNYNLFDASTAFWLEQEKDGLVHFYPLESNTLDVNLVKLQKVMKEVN